jgi:pilus assembly protein Flp/PilA
MLMKRIRSFGLRYLRLQRGATAIEYGLLAAGIAMAIAVAVFLFGDAIYSLLYEDLATALDG